MKNVEYKSTKDDIIEHFKNCGKIVRVTIVNDRFTGHPKGYYNIDSFRCCYIEFAETDSIENALLLTDTILKGRTIQVFPKRTNIPDKTRRPPMRGGRGGFYSGCNMMLM